MCYLEQMTIDPITADVIRHRFDAATDEMLVTLVKTAFSPHVKERRDCSAACFDVNGDLISLSASAPMHLSSLMGMVQNIVKRFPLESIRQGDMYLTNDPYVGGGSHLPDLTLTSPVFFEGRLVMFVATTAHHSDIGGKASGSESADCISIFQEGLRLPPVRLMAEGELRQDILDILLLNSRTPFHREGDMKAQIASNLIGVRRLEELLRRFGVETVLAGIEALFDYSEARTRAAIAKLKDGSYENEDFLDHDGVEPRMVPLKVKVTIAGDSIHFDFTGSAPQIAGARNCVMMATLACVFAAFKVVTDPALAPNAGSYRPIRVTAPEGTIMNCVPPASVGDRGQTANIVGDLLLGALGKAGAGEGAGGRRREPGVGSQRTPPPPQGVHRRLRRVCGRRRGAARPRRHGRRAHARGDGGQHADRGDRARIPARRPQLRAAAGFGRPGEVSRRFGHEARRTRVGRGGAAVGARLGPWAAGAAGPWLAGRRGRGV